MELSVRSYPSCKHLNRLPTVFSTGTCFDSISSVTSPLSGQVQDFRLQLWLTAPVICQAAYAVSVNTGKYSAALASLGRQQTEGQKGGLLWANTNRLHPGTLLLSQTHRPGWRRANSTQISMATRITTFWLPSTEALLHIFSEEAGWLHKVLIKVGLTFL